MSQSEAIEEAKAVLREMHAQISTWDGETLPMLSDGEVVPIRMTMGTLRRASRALAGLDKVEVLER